MALVFQTKRNQNCLRGDGSLFVSENDNTAGTGRLHNIVPGVTELLPVVYLAALS
jgi:hypothetical protein